MSQLAEFQVLFHVSPSLRVEVFGFVGDVVLLVFARLFAFLALGPFFTVRLQVSLSPTNHGGEHPLVETRKITCHEYVTRSREAVSTLSLKTKACRTSNSLIKKNLFKG